MKVYCSLHFSEMKVEDATLMKNNFKRCQLAETNPGIPGKNKQIYHKQRHHKGKHNQEIQTWT